MPTVPTAPATTRPAAPRLLSGAGGGRSRSGDTSSFPSTLPLPRPPVPVPAPPPAAAMPRWAKGVAIGGVLLAIAMPVSVLLSRSMLVQAALTEQNSSKAAMVCTAGEGRALDDSSLLGWLFGGSYFSCGDWETREARLQRDRERDQASFLARERAKQLR